MVMLIVKITLVVLFIHRYGQEYVRLSVRGI